jgi:hypothetical protein
MPGRVFSDRHSWEAIVTRIALAVIVSLAAFSPLRDANARDDVHVLKLKETFDNPDFTKRVGNAVAFKFGQQPAPPGQSIEEYVARGANHFHGKTVEDRCQDTLIDALENFKKRAAKVGGDAVVGVVSFYKSKTFSSATEYECHEGANGVLVTLKGAIVKSQPGV